jgi:integrase/recombinase XerD
LSAFNSGFAAELVRLGYRPNAAANQSPLMAHLSRWMAQHGVTADKLTAAVLSEFLAARPDAGYRLWLSPKALSLLLAYLRGLGVAPDESETKPAGAAQTLLARYRGYLIRERDYRLPPPGCMRI